MYSVITREMLRSLACPYRYELEHERHLRNKSFRRPPWPPRTRKTVDIALRERDRCAMQYADRTPGERESLARQSMARAMKTMEARLKDVAPSRDHHKIERSMQNAGQVLRYYVEKRQETFEDFIAVDGATTAGLVCHFPLAGVGGHVLHWIDRIDGVVARGDDKPPALLLRKFTKSGSPDEVRGHLELDVELAGKVWLARQLTGEPIDTVRVEVVRTKAPSKPDTIQCRKCKGSGQVVSGSDGGSGSTACAECNGTGIGGVSQQRCDTTLAVWQKSVLGYGLDLAVEAQRCSKQVIQLQERGDVFVYTMNMQITDSVVEQWRDETLALANTRWLHRGAGRWPRNTTQCNGGVSPCRYRYACTRAMNEDLEGAYFVHFNDPTPGIYRYNQKETANEQA